MSKNIIMQIGSIVGLLFLNTLIYSCATTQIPVSPSGIFHSNHGFSIQLPSGNSWEKKLGNDLLSFKKLPKHGFRSFHAGASEFVLAQEFQSSEDFLVFVKKTSVRF